MVTKINILKLKRIFFHWSDIKEKKEKKRNND